MPLVEIVSRPDMRTAEQARQYVTELRAILVAVGASDAKMEEGSMRVDANVSVRRPGEPFGTRCEIKNVNSVRSLGRAIEYEARRQIDLIEAGETVRQETRHWDEADGRTHTLRVKEDADDYRYFLEPDLVPLAPDAANGSSAVRAALPCCPAPAGARWPRPPGGAADSEAVDVVVERGQDDYVLRRRRRRRRRRREPLVHVKEAFADQGADPAVPAADLAALDAAGGRRRSSRPRKPRRCSPSWSPTAAATPAAIAAAKGFEAMDTGALEALVDEAIAANAGRVGRSTAAARTRRWARWSAR